MSPQVRAAESKSMQQTRVSVALVSTGTIIHTAVHLTYGKSATTDRPRHCGVRGHIAPTPTVFWKCGTEPSLLVTTAAAKCDLRSVVIIIELSYRYRDNFDLSYRLSIENSIWHIVTALVVAEIMDKRHWWDSTLSISMSAVGSWWWRLICGTP